MSYVAMIVNMLGVLVMTITAVAYFTLFERKVLGLSQSRLGPQNVGFLGVAQPLVDALKLIVKKKESAVPTSLGRSVLILISPVLFLVVVSVSWAAYPSMWCFFSCQSIVVFTLVILGLAVYGTVMIGWVSKSKYSVIGAMRAVSQSISYEVVLILAITSVMWCVGSTNFPSMWEFASLSPFVAALLTSFVMSFIALLAESGRVPFDLPEGESEIVAGWNVELAGFSFTLAFLGEQMSIVWSCVLLVSLFLGNSFLLLKVLFILGVCVLTRSAYPRVRFDKVMVLCWTQLLPLLIGVTCLIMILC